MTDKLQELLNYQKAFQQQRGKFTGLEPVEETRELLLYAHEELTEILKSLNSKPYRANGRFKESSIKEEIIDSLKYNLILMNIFGMDSEEVCSEFYRKSNVVEKRWIQELDLKLENGKVACIDIDGVLCDWMKTWVHFLCSKRECDAYWKSHSENIVDSSEILINKGNYSNLKYEFRESGKKCDAFVYPGAKEFLERISENYQIMIVSARPIDDHPRLFADTIEWMSNNQLQYDGIVFENDKRSWVLANQGKVAFCVDDDPIQAQKLSSVGVFTYLVDKPYNRNLNGPNIIRIKSLEEILLECKSI